ncbi:hypothetical protein [Aliivibrio kagoshimensis]|uniref:hypothetical protein n=1 Tax=Aliivibrio kagoshimensis TaxID=2910230 RepID=UPI003D0998D5
MSATDIAILKKNVSCLVLVLWLSLASIIWMGMLVLIEYLFQQDYSIPPLLSAIIPPSLVGYWLGKRSGYSFSSKIRWKAIIIWATVVEALIPSLLFYQFNEESWHQVVDEVGVGLLFLLLFILTVHILFSNVMFKSGEKVGVKLFNQHSRTNTVG